MKPFYLLLALSSSLTFAEGEITGPITLSQAQVDAMNRYSACRETYGYSASERRSADVLCEHNIRNPRQEFSITDLVGRQNLPEIPPAPHPNAPEAQRQAWLDEASERVARDLYTRSRANLYGDSLGQMGGSDQDAFRALQSSVRGTLNKALRNYVNPIVQNGLQSNPIATGAALGVVGLGAFYFDGMSADVYRMEDGGGRSIMRLQLSYDGIANDDQRVMLTLRFR